MPTVPSIGLQPANPWVYKATDAFGKSVMIVFPWDNTTRALQDATMSADQGCLYTTVYVGLGPDGKVTSSVQKINVPQGQGTRTLPASRLELVGLKTIDDILNTQITAAA